MKSEVKHIRTLFFKSRFIRIIAIPGYITKTPTPFDPFFCPTNHELLHFFSATLSHSKPSPSAASKAKASRGQTFGSAFNRFFDFSFVLYLHLNSKLCSFSEIFISPEQREKRINRSKQKQEFRSIPS